MNRIEQIRENLLFRKCMEEIAYFERERIYCGHDFAHLLDVARIAYILNLEAGGGLPKALIYAAALLHDVGRAEQYKSKRPHDEAGAEIAEVILRDCDFTEDEVFIMTQAVCNHRISALEGKEAGLTQNSEFVCNQAALLSEYIWKADKASRQCDLCAAIDSCNWPKDKKNLKITV